MSSQNYYDTLGVSKDADENEIKKAYRSLSLKYHPDRNHSPEANSTFQSINQAYEILSDPQSKQQYDMELKFGQGMGQGTGQGTGQGMPLGFSHGMPGGMAFNFGGMPFGHMSSMDEFQDINNIFNMMFNGGGMPGPGGIFGGPGGIKIHFQQSISKPEPITKTVEITLEQCYNGYTLPIDIDRIIVINNNRTSETETIYVNIPRGIDENETLLLENKGHIINNTVHGDVKIMFKINNETEFQRRGMDLIYAKKISLKEALCGFVFEIHHINGKNLCLNNKTNKSVIKPNYKKVVPNLGMVRENSTGNMIIEFEIVFPDALTEEQVAGLENILL